jgi:hypothetical protein
MKTDKQKITIMVLSIVIFLFSQYIILNTFLQQNEENLFQSFQNGYQHGLIDAISKTFEQTENCQIAIITIKNLTKEIIDFSCLEEIPSIIP